MRTEADIESRIEDLQESAEDAPDELAEKIQAQVHILQWVLDGDFSAPDGEIVTHLEHDPHLFDQILLGATINGQIYVDQKIDEPGKYVLIRRDDI